MADAFRFIILRQQQEEIRYKLITPGGQNAKLLRPLMCETNSIRGYCMEQAFEIGLKQEVDHHFLLFGIDLY